MLLKHRRNLGERVSIIRFADDARVVPPFEASYTVPRESESDQLELAFRAIVDNIGKAYGQATNTGLAVSKARAIVEANPQAQHEILLLTDGIPTDVRKWQQHLRWIHDTPRVHLFVVDVGTLPQREVFRAVMQAGGRFWYVKTLAELLEIVGQFTRGTPPKVSTLPFLSSDPMAPAPSWSSQSTQTPRIPQLARPPRSMSSSRSTSPACVATPRSPQSTIFRHGANKASRKQDFFRTPRGAQREKSSLKLQARVSEGTRALEAGHHASAGKAYGKAGDLARQLGMEEYASQLEAKVKEIRQYRAALAEWEAENQDRQKRAKMEAQVRAGIAEGDRALEEGLLEDSLQAFQRVRPLAGKTGDPALSGLVQKRLHAAQEAIQKRQRDLLRKIVQVSVKLPVARLADLLGLEERACWRRVVDWAAEFDFQIDDDMLLFAAGRKEAFIAQLETEFATWGTGTSAGKRE